MGEEIIFWNPKIDFENGAADDDYSLENKMKKNYKKFSRHQKCKNRRMK